MKAVKIAGVISENVVPVQYPSGRETTVLARDLVASSECYSLNEQQAVLSEATNNTSNSQSETITVQLLEKNDVSNGELSEVPKKELEKAIVIVYSTFCCIVIICSV